MIDFDRWFDRAASNADKEAADLQDGITLIDGRFMAICCCCEKTDEIPVDINEIPQEGYKHYCGGSPRCLP